MFSLYVYNLFCVHFNTYYKAFFNVHFFAFGCWMVSESFVEETILESVNESRTPLSIIHTHLCLYTRVSLSVSFCCSSTLYVYWINSTTLSVTKLYKSLNHLVFVLQFCSSLLELFWLASLVSLHFYVTF